MFTEYFLHDGIRVECVEPDAKNIDALCALGVKVAASITLLPNTHFGFAYTINVLEHLHDVGYYLGQLHRVLRQNGLPFVFVPAFNALWTSLDDEVGHVQRFTQRSLHRYLERRDFKWKNLIFQFGGFPRCICRKVLEAFGLFKSRRKRSGSMIAIFPISLAGDIFLSSSSARSHCNCPKI